MNRVTLVPNMIWFCIDSYDNEELSGRIYSIMREKPLEFRNFHQFILLADQLFDDISYPQSFVEKRTFKEKEMHQQYSRRSPVTKSCDIINQIGSLATFVILVETRQYTNWQGKLYSLDFKTAKSFNDIVSLMYIMIQEINKKDSLPFHLNGLDHKEEF